MGFNVKPSVKGKDSVEFGHQRVRQYHQHWTKDSVNAIKEQRNFRYIQDKNGRYTDKTTHAWSHLMDARRYAILGPIPEDQESIIIHDALSSVMAELDL